MIPFERAFATYDAEEDFWRDLHAHLACGYVHSTPDYFVMARPVLSTARPEEIANAFKTWSEPDAWFIWLMAGDMTKAWGRFPFELPLIGFSRRGGKAKFLSFQAVKKRLARS